MTEHGDTTSQPTRRSPSSRSTAGVRRALLGAAALFVVAALAACEPSTSITFRGHGYGHRRGMGQWGAYGYAVDRGWSWQQIVDHYYGGTQTSQAGANVLQRVLMLGNVGRDLVVYQERGHLTTTAGAPQAGATAVRVQRLDDTRFQLFDGPGCGGPWTARALVTAAELEVVPTVRPTEDRAEMLQLCEAAGQRLLRGSLIAVHTSGTIKTVNRVDTESMLRTVVAREMSPSWATAGGGRGLQALAAQAVAARSYVMAGDTRWGSIATTCDILYCQTYSGVAYRPNGGSWSIYEDSRVDPAVSTTVGLIRRFPSGKIAATEFSASSGGWSRGPVFTPVIDEGDATAANPNHDWTVTIAASTIETAFDRRQGRDMGALQSIVVTQRDGNGADGGGVTSAVVHFSGGDVTVTGDQMRSTLGLKSDWFTPSVS